jgi:MFS family permease
MRFAAHRRASLSTLIVVWGLFLLLQTTVIYGFTNAKSCTRISRSPVTDRNKNGPNINPRKFKNAFTPQDKMSSAVAANAATADSDKLPSTIIPILLSVLALILSEGIALSTLALHMQSMGATPAIIGLSTSAFSIAQMICCPVLVALSAKIGRRKTLRLCLLGAAVSSCVIACATTIPLLIFARFLAGVFAASIPVAQAGVTDIVPPHQIANALSQVSAASQTGLVIGPIASAFIQGLMRSIGIPSKYMVRGVFAASAFFALFALAAGGAGTDAPPLDSSAPTKKSAGKHVPVVVQKASESITSLPLAEEITKHPEYIQPCLRVIAVLASWALTLSVSTYSMFSSRFLGYAQPQLSAAMSLGAAATIATQILIVPRMVKKAGVHLSDTLGLWLLAIGLAGTSLLRSQPLHTLFYLLIRVGTGIADTATGRVITSRTLETNFVPYHA